MFFMKTAAIIAEYNPFHLGHAEQFRLVKEKFGDDCRIVVIMSGPFVQRGEAAVLSREDRAKACLAAGASLVMELPLAFATASARDFARGGVRLLKAAGICTDLVCGAEDADLSDDLAALAALLNEEPPKFKEYLQAALDEGLNFPAARERAAVACCPERAAGWQTLLNKPNNILALEYQMAVWAANRNEKNPYRRLKLHLLPRTGDDRRADFAPDEHFASATAIRAFLSREPSKAKRLLTLEKYVPEDSLALLLTRPLLLPGRQDELLLNLLAARPDKDLLPYRYMDEGLAARLRKAVDRAAAQTPESAAEEAERIWAWAGTRYYAKTRFKRALLSWCLGLKKEDWEKIQEDGPAFIRVLGCDKHGRYLLRLMRKLAALPRVDKASDLLENLSSPLATCGLQQALALGGDRLYRALAPEKFSIFDSYIQIR